MRLDYRHVLPDERERLSHGEVADRFGPGKQVALTLAIVAINGWNRLAVGFRQPVGDFVSHLHTVPA